MLTSSMPDQETKHRHDDHTHGTKRRRHLNTETPLNVLLVEDEPASVALTLEALRDPKIAYEVHTVEDGEQALKYLRKQSPFEVAPRPDIILLDLNLPKVDGREVLATIRGDANLAAIPVVVLTSSANPEDVAMMYHFHVAGYITKPAQFNEYFTAIRSLKELWFKHVTLQRYDTATVAN
jgi:CheY-like chemotaxis protein